MKRYHMYFATPRDHYGDMVFRNSTITSDGRYLCVGDFDGDAEWIEGEMDSDPAVLEYRAENVA